MNDELSILYQAPDGDVYDYTGLTTAFNISASLKAEATKAQFTFVRDDDLQIEMGGVIHVTAGELTIFYGFVFTVRMSQDVAVQVDAYDALRYLKNEVFYPWPKQTLSERFKDICENVSLLFRWHNCEFGLLCVLWRVCGDYVGSQPVVRRASLKCTQVFYACFFSFCASA